MGQPLSVDLRERVVTFVAAGHSPRAAAQHFEVGDSSAIRLMRRVGYACIGEPGWADANDVHKKSPNVSFQGLQSQE